MSVVVLGERAIYFRLAHTFSELELDSYNKSLFDRKKNPGKVMEKGRVRYLVVPYTHFQDILWTNKLFKHVGLSSREEKNAQIYKLFKKIH